MINVDNLIKTIEDDNSPSNMKKVKDVLERASYSYYNTQKLLLSDKDFDRLSKAYENCGGILDVGIEPLSNKKTVEVEHQFYELVGGLEKVNTIKELREYLEKTFINENVSLKEKIKYVLTLKFDGNSVVIEYNKGKVVRALTRGKNGKGMDLTHVFKNHTIKDKRHIGIKYEVIITWDKFDKLIEDFKVSYANPRSLVAGKLSDDNAPDYYKYMTLTPLWVKPKDSSMNREEQLQFIKDNFEETNPMFNFLEVIEGDLDTLIKKVDKVYKHFSTSRKDLPFMIDGLVLEITDDEMKEHLGYIRSLNKPKWAVAIKFPYLETTTTVTGFDFTVGDSGRVTPRVWFKPIKFNGTEHTKQSLQNYDRFKKLNLGIGSRILVQYRNDCLSYVNPIEDDNNKNIERYKFPTRCPKCGSKLKINKNRTFVFCVNDKCPSRQIGRINNFLNKVDIKGIERNTIEKLNEANLLNDIEDLYTMDYDKIKDVEGFKEKSANNIKNAINKKKPYDYEILAGLGIVNVSLITAKEICKKFTLKELYDMFIKYEVDFPMQVVLMGINGISEITANYIIKGFRKDIKLIKFFIDRDILYYKDVISSTTNENTKTIVFTGFRDKEVQNQLELKGHKITSSVSKNTDLLVCKDISKKSSKITKANELGIKVVSKDEFYDNILETL